MFRLIIPTRKIQCVSAAGRSGFPPVFPSLSFSPTSQSVSERGQISPQGFSAASEGDRSTKRSPKAITHRDSAIQQHQHHFAAHPFSACCAFIKGHRSLRSVLIFYFSFLWFFLNYFYFWFTCPHLRKPSAQEGAGESERKEEKREIRRRRRRKAPSQRASSFWECNFARLREAKRVSFCAHIHLLWSDIHCFFLVAAASFISSWKKSAPGKERTIFFFPSSENWTQFSVTFRLD